MTTLGKDIQMFLIFHIIYHWLVKFLTFETCLTILVVSVGQSITVAMPRALCIIS